MHQICYRHVQSVLLWSLGFTFTSYIHYTHYTITFTLSFISFSRASRQCCIIRNAKNCPSITLPIINAWECALSWGGVGNCWHVLVQRILSLFISVTFPVYILISNMLNIASPLLFLIDTKVQKPVQPWTTTPFPSPPPLGCLTYSFICDYI